MISNRRISYSMYMKKQNSISQIIRLCQMNQSYCGEKNNFNQMLKILGMVRCLHISNEAMAKTILKQTSVILLLIPILAPSGDSVVDVVSVVKYFLTTVQILLSPTINYPNYLSF